MHLFVFLIHLDWFFCSTAAESKNTCVFVFGCLLVTSGISINCALDKVQINFKEKQVCTACQNLLTLPLWSLRVYFCFFVPCDFMSIDRKSRWHHFDNADVNSQKFLQNSFFFNLHKNFSKSKRMYTKSRIFDNKVSCFVGASWHRHFWSSSIRVHIHWYFIFMSMSRHFEITNKSCST